MMRILIFISLISMIGKVVEGQTSFSIEEAVKYAIENSKQLKIDHIDIAKAEKEVKSFIAKGLPSLSGGVEYQYFFEIPTSFLPGEIAGQPAGTLVPVQFGVSNSLKASLSMNSLIFDMSYITGIKAQKFYEKLTKKSVSQTQFDIRKSVTEAYFNVLLMDENILLLDKNIENLKAIIDETNEFLKAGFVEKLDLDRLELSLDDLVSKRKQLVHGVKISKDLLKFQMSYPISQDIQLTQDLNNVVDKVLVDFMNQDKNVNYNDNIQHQSIEIGQKLLDLQLEATHYQRYPSLYGFANYQQQLQRNKLFDKDEAGFTPIGLVGLKLDVPIYKGGSIALEEQKVRLEMEKTRLQKELLEQGIDIQVETAYEQYLNAIVAMSNAKRKESLANTIYDVAKIKYKEGVGSSIELSQAENEIYAGQRAYMQALFDLLTSKLKLDIAKGTLQAGNY